MGALRRIFFQKNENHLRVNKSIKEKNKEKKRLRISKLFFLKKGLTFFKNRYIIGKREKMEEKNRR